MATEGDLTINLTLNTDETGVTAANNAADAIQGVEQAQGRQTVATTRATTSIGHQVKALNMMQNLAFRGFVTIGRLAGANSALAHTINAVAFGADVAFGALQAYIALSGKMRASAAVATPILAGQGIAQTGPAAPIMGPAIVAAIIGGIAAVALAVASTPGAASGAVITEPTLIRAGEKGREGIFPLPPGGGFGGGTNEIIIGSRPLRDALTKQSNRDWVSGRA